MIDFHPDDQASLQRLRSGGEEEIAYGPVGQLISELREGKHGRPGALRLLISGQNLPIVGKDLSVLVERD